MTLKHPVSILLNRTIAICLYAFASLTTGFAEDKTPSERPNLVIILIDDLGYHDVGYNGNTIHRTPNIDRLSREGASFSDFYVTSPTCTPTRIALLTGRHPARWNSHGVLWPTSKGGLSPKDVTIAEWLRDAGYATGIAGKWHVGHFDHEQLPMGQGFDSWYGIPYPNDMGPGHPQERVRGENWPPIPMYRDDDIVEAPVDPNLLTQQFTAEAVRFIAENHSRPFFLYLSHAMPHTILGASPEFRGKSENGIYGDAVEELDWSVGEVMKTLRTFGIEERTMVVFTNDNGAVFGDSHPEAGEGWRTAGSNAPFRSGKQYLFEGGVRVPAIIWWPNHIEAGLKINSPAIITDLIPTFAELAGIETLPSAIDGESLAPFLRGEKPSAERTLFFGSGDVRAARRGKWKLMLSAQPSWQINLVEDIMLFDLENDPGETKNLKSFYPKITSDLETAIRNFNESIGVRENFGLPK